MQHRAKKSFGQNFLKDQAIKHQIIKAIPESIKAANATNKCEIIEIGPGLGDLTESLLKANLTLKSIEIDVDLINLLQEKFAKEIADKNWQLIQGDALNWQSDQKYFIVANLPYNISAPLVIKALCDNLCFGQLVMVQLEMAERILNTDVGPLGILTAVQCEQFELICKVAPSAFEPAPKVMSAVILLRRGACALDETEAKDFINFLKKMFISPRKQLKSAIKSNPKAMQIASELELLNLRPAQISASSFLEFYKRMKDGRDK